MMNIIITPVAKEDNLKGMAPVPSALNISLHKLRLQTLFSVN